MFAPYCPRHESRVLLGYESVIAIEQTPTGPRILLHCHCGELLAHDSLRPPMPAAASAPSRGRPVSHSERGWTRRSPTPHTVTMTRSAYFYGSGFFYEKSPAAVDAV